MLRTSQIASLGPLAFTILLAGCGPDEVGTDEVGDTSTESESSTTSDESTSDESTSDESTTDETTTDESTSDESTSDETTTDESTTDESTTDETTTDETTTDETTDESTTDETTTDETTTDETTDTGGDVCAVEGTDNACTECTKSSCCDQYAACLGNTGCECTFECVSEGGGAQGCLQQCGVMNIPPEALSLASCLQTDCQECGL